MDDHKKLNEPTTGFQFKPAMLKEPKDDWASPDELQIKELVSNALRNVKKDNHWVEPHIRRIKSTFPAFAKCYQQNTSDGKYYVAEPRLRETLWKEVNDEIRGIESSVASIIDKENDKTMSKRRFWLSLFATAIISGSSGWVKWLYDKNENEELNDNLVEKIEKLENERTVTLENITSLKDKIEIQGSNLKTIDVLAEVIFKIKHNEKHQIWDSARSVLPSTFLLLKSNNNTRSQIEFISHGHKGLYEKMPNGFIRYRVHASTKELPGSINIKKDLNKFDTITLNMPFHKVTENTEGIVFIKEIRVTFNINKDEKVAWNESVEKDSFLLVKSYNKKSNVKTIPKDFNLTAQKPDGKIFKY